MYVFSGATGAIIHEIASPNPQRWGGFGHALAEVGDVDRDGVADHLIGTWAEHGPRRQAGLAYLTSGATGEVLRELASPNPAAEGHFGFAVAALGDVTGDGVAEYLVGAHGEDGGAVAAGRVYVYSASAVPTSVYEGGQARVTLDPPHPTPASGPVRIAFELPVPSLVRRAVYDVLGREVGPRAAGRHAVVLDGTRLPAGVYLVRLEAGGAVQTQRITRVR